jgi:hypothetical protein
MRNRRSWQWRGNVAWRSDRACPDAVNTMSTQPKVPAVYFTLPCDEGYAAGMATCVPALMQATRVFLSLPFDALREQYAQSVRAGIVERSLLASGHFERALGALEQLSYGPFARRV